MHWMRVRNKVLFSPLTFSSAGFYVPQNSTKLWTKQKKRRIVPPFFPACISSSQLHCPKNNKEQSCRMQQGANYSL